MCVCVADFAESWTTRRYLVNDYPIEMLFSANGFKAKEETEFLMSRKNNT